LCHRHHGLSEWRQEDRISRLADQNVLIETTIVRELIPYVDENFRTVASSLPAPWRMSMERMAPQARAKVSGDVRLGRRLRRLYKRLPLDGYFPGIAPEQQAWMPS